MFEVLAISRLENSLIEKLVPVFDVPANTYEDNDSSIKAKLDKVSRGLHKKLKSFPNGLFIDTFDIDPRIRIGGLDHPYEYLLNELSDLHAFPVIGLDREPEHVEVAITHCTELDKPFAVRLLPEDLRLPTDTVTDLSELLEASEALDRSFYVFYDLRNLPSSISEIDRLVDVCSILSELLIDKFNIEEFIVSGSSMPLRLTDTIRTNQRGRIDRLEFYLWDKFLAEHSALDVGLGDYCTVSPEYVEVPPYVYTSIMSAKIIYSERDHFYITRGAKLETAGHAQYATLAGYVIAEADYRGKNFSYGDDYINTKSNSSTGPYGNPGSWMGTALNCHMSLCIDTYF